LKSKIAEFRNLTVLRDRKILNRVSFDIEEGCHTAIIGPNGSGKSTLINLITRNHYPLADEPGYKMNIWGRDDWNVTELKKLLGIVSDTLSRDFEEDMPVKEAVLSGFFSSVGLFHVKVTPKMKMLADKNLKFMGIKKLENESVAALSSGEKRKMLIARALVHAPKALILDEPSNGLDIIAAEKFRRTMRKLCAKTTVIIATNDFFDIIPEIKKVIMLKNGKVFMQGAKEKLMTSKNLSRLFGGKISAGLLNRGRA